jgi:hypothetical protein
VLGYFIIDGPPPTRHDPGSCANRTSPNASPLFQAVTAFVATDPGAFPLSEPVGVVIVSGGPFDEPEGYTVATAIEEVLVDAGFLADERQVEWEGHDIQPDMATGYSVRVEPATA